MYFGDFFKDLRQVLALDRSKLQKKDRLALPFVIVSFTLAFLGLPVLIFFSIFFTCTCIIPVFGALDKKCSMDGFREARILQEVSDLVFIDYLILFFFIIISFFPLIFSMITDYDLRPVQLKKDEELQNDLKQKASDNEVVGLEYLYRQKYYIQIIFTLIVPIGGSILLFLVLMILKDLGYWLPFSETNVIPFIFYIFMFVFFSFMINIPIFSVKRDVIRILKSQKLKYFNTDERSKDIDYLNERENILLEFKASFRTPYPSYPEPKEKNGRKIYVLNSNQPIEFHSIPAVQKYLETIVLKSIVGFLNSQGGNLVIGIFEDKINRENKFVGIKREEEKLGRRFEDLDNYERYINQQIANRIGRKFLGDYINFQFQEIGADHICIIKIQPFFPTENEVPAFLDKESCFRRTGPRTDELRGVEFAEFVSSRTKSN